MTIPVSFYLMNTSSCKESHLTFKLDWISGIANKVPPQVFQQEEIVILTYKTFYYYFKDICKRQQKINCSHFKKTYNTLLFPLLSFDKKIVTLLFS